jgi:hypothetical protein
LFGSTIFKVQGGLSPIFLKNCFQHYFFSKKFFWGDKDSYVPFLIIDKVKKLPHFKSGNLTKPQNFLIFASNLRIGNFFLAEAVRK